MNAYRLTLLAASLMLAASLRAASAPILPVAVLDFESSDTAVQGMGSKISTLVNAELSAADGVITVEREELSKLLSEQELGLGGTLQADTAAKVGHLTGAKVIITGKIFRADKELIVVAKIIGTETGRVFGELAKGPAEGSLTDIASKIAAKIAADINKNATNFVPAVITVEDRIESIKKAISGKELPSVSVKVPETHFGQRVVDPAAQTELEMILQKCGFKVVDDKSTETPAVEISGEAFSAYGMRKGNLISCRSRIELKAHSKGDGKVLAVDRQTSVAVDIAEQSAAKTSLQNAVDEIAQRLVPALVR